MKNFVGGLSWEELSWEEFSWEVLFGYGEFWFGYENGRIGWTLCLPTLVLAMFPLLGAEQSRAFVR